MGLQEVKRGPGRGCPVELELKLELIQNPLLLVGVMGSRSGWLFDNSKSYQRAVAWGALASPEATLAINNREPRNRMLDGISTRAMCDNTRHSWSYEAKATLPHFQRAHMYSHNTFSLFCTYIFHQTHMSTRSTSFRHMGSPT
jgi:hypothetical protein